MSFLFNISVQTVLPFWVKVVFSPDTVRAVELFEF